MIIAYDIGTTVLKGAVLDEEGRFLSEARRPLPPGGRGSYEADPRAWMRALKAVTDEITAKISSSGLRAAVICGNGPTLVPVDSNGRFLGPVMTWLDRRGTEQSKRIGRLQSFEIDPSFYLPKAMWIADNLPQVYEKTRFFLSCPESVAYRLTGEAVTILPGKRFEKYFWTEQLLSETGMDPGKFPAFVKPGHMTGRVTASAASEYGLPSGLPVISAGPDFAVSLLGTAAVYPGRASDRSGTSEGINLCTEKYVEDPRLMGYGHIVEPWYNVSGIISTSGKALEWAREKFSGPEAGYTDFINSASGVNPGADGLVFLPYLAGERAPHWDPSARGAFIGLGLNHNRAHMVRAVLESIGFAMRDVIEVMAENGGNVTELRITGGPSKSRLWNSIKADITGKNILVPESSEAELMGNLILALRTLGDTDELAETADRLVRIREVYGPDLSKHSRYDDYFGIYRESYRKLRDIFKSLQAAGKGEV